METDKKLDLSPAGITFAAACRWPSGRAMCDSGGAYGRHWEKDPLPEELPIIREWDEGCPATIETAAFLDAQMEIDRDWQKRWSEFDAARDEFIKTLRKCQSPAPKESSWLDLVEKFENDEWAEPLTEAQRMAYASVIDEMDGHGPYHPDRDYFASVHAFMEAIGYEIQAEDNVYNGENDLSQVYVYHVWAKAGSDMADGGEWFYPCDEAITILFIHTGCDVRGGYSGPIFCAGKNDYSVPMDLCAEYHACPIPKPAPDPNQMELDMEIEKSDPWAELREIDEQWQCGYASYPYGALEKDVAEWHEETRTNDSVEVTLNSGKRILVQASAPNCY